MGNFFSDLGDSFKKPEVYIPTALAALGGAPYFFPETFSGGGLLGGIGSLGRGIGSTVGVDYDMPEGASDFTGGKGLLTGLMDKASSGSGTKGEKGGISDALLGSLLTTGGALGGNMMNLEAQKERYAREDKRYEENRAEQRRKDKIEMQLMLIQERKAAAKAEEEASAKAKKLKIQAIQAAMENINAQGPSTTGAFNSMMSGIAGAYR